MNKFINLIIIGIMILCLIGCSKDSELKFANDVKMIIKEGTLSKKSATVIITDLDNNENIYGEWFRIDKLVDDEWIELEPINDNFVFNYIGYLVDENNKLEIVCKWDYIYGELESGKYRLVKYMIPYEVSGSATDKDKEYFWVEFMID